MFSKARITNFSCHKYLHNNGGRFLLRRDREVSHSVEEPILKDIVIKLHNKIFW